MWAKAARELPVVVPVNEAAAGATMPPRALQKWHAYALSALALFACTAVGLGLAISQTIIARRSFEGPRVDLNYTVYVGTRRESGINVFLGMRYAQPPLGDLRWRAPVDPSPGGGVTRAQTFGPICLATDATYPNSQQDEDCLFVNVWAPEGTNATSRLPVWLFIQGGGYVSNSNANWDGEEVVKRSNKSIVFVNFNYRAGVFGFLAGAKVRSDGDLNVGLLDQRLVMQWIQKHITKFGGDPNHVVVSGLSAGAGSVALHLAAYGGRDDGLFSGAIVESMFFPAQPYLSELEWQFQRLVDDAGCNGTAQGQQDPMACLRAKTTAVLQAANKASPFPGRTESPLPLFYWTPCVDGDLIRRLPYDMFERGETIRMPMIMGTVTNEGSYFGANASSRDEMLQFMHNNYPGLQARDLYEIAERYPLMAALPEHQAWFPSASMAYGEATFTCPTAGVLDAVAARNGTAWAYRFAVQDRDLAARGLGVPHTAEAAAVFGPDSIAGQAPAGYYSYNAAMVPLVMDYWISFVRTRSPNPLRSPGAPPWDPYPSRVANASGAADAAYFPRARLVLETDKNRMEQVPADELSRCLFWMSLKDRTQQKL